MVTTPNFLDGMILEAECAKIADESKRTWQRRRQQRTGPPYIPLGVHIYYRDEVLRAWLLAREVKPLVATKRRSPPQRARIAARDGEAA